MIEVINKQTSAARGTYIGRPSPLGNPYSHLPSACAEFRVATRDEAVEKYREWLTRALESDKLVHAAFWNLVEFYRQHGSLTLVCWCAPENCHGNVIRDMIMEALTPSEASDKVALNYSETSSGRQS